MNRLTLKRFIEQPCFTLNRRETTAVIVLLNEAITLGRGDIPCGHGDDGTDLARLRDKMMDALTESETAR